MRISARDTSSHSIRKNLWLFLPFALSLLVMFLIYNRIGIYPFGDKVAFYWDGQDQIHPYLQALRSSMVTGQDIGFSMNALFGMDNTALFAYYLSSPFNILLLLFPQNLVVDAYSVIILIKIAAAAVTFSIFAHYQFRANRYICTLLSLGYALMGYVASYSYFCMWLDGVVWLPLICYGLHRLLEGKSPVLLILSFAILFFSNYYVGFIAALFSIFYFCILAAEKISRQNWKEYGKKACKFALSGCIAFGMTVFLILPTFLLMRSGMDVFGVEVAADDTLFPSLLNVFPSLMSGGAVADYGLKLFVGVLSTILAAGFLCCKDFSRRKRIIYGSGFVFLLLTQQISKTNAIWHLMSPPRGFEHRNSFIISFLILVMAVQMAVQITQKTANARRAFYAGLLSVLGLLLLYNGVSDYNALSGKMYVRNLILILCIGAVFTFLVYFHKKRICVFVACALLLCGMTADVFNNTSQAFQLYGLAERTRYTGKQETISDILQTIKRQDPGLFRVGDETSLTANDNMGYNYWSGIHHSSAEDMGVVQFANSMGFLTKGWSYRTFFVSNMITDSIFGFRYIVPEQKENPAYQQQSTEAGNTFEKNPNALPLIFSAPGSLGEMPQQESSALVQQSLLQQIGAPASMYDVMRRRIDRSGAEFTLEKDGVVYLYLPAQNFVYEIKVNGEIRFTETATTEDPRQICLGEFHKGDVIDVKAIDYEEDVSFGTITISVINTAEFTQYFTGIQSKTQNFTRPADTVFEADVESAEGDNLYFTIPQSSGWKLYIDDVEVPVDSALQVFMGAQISAGKHHVRMEYHRPGMTVGVVISVFSTLMFLTICVWEIRKRHAGRKNKK